MSKREESNPDAATPAEEAYAEYVRRTDAGEPLPFDFFCLARPELAGELRRLHEQRSGEPLPPDEGTKRIEVVHKDRSDIGAGKPRPAPEPDPRISLRGDPTPEGHMNSSMLLQRVAVHSPEQLRYKLKGEVARGGMGAILEVWDEDLRRKLALKVLLSEQETPDGKPTREADPRELARFLEEAQVTAQLEHPGIVPVHELGVDSSGRVYFSMRLVRGRDFGKILDLVHEGREGWTRTRALGVLLKVCEAMAYAHAKGVIHRDLKPENVMVGRFGETYVMDWGLARVLDMRPTLDQARDRERESTDSAIHTDRHDEQGVDPASPLLTMDGDIIGTPSYMSPEQAKGSLDEMGPRSDVYSLGAILYHLLTGRMPYVDPEAETNAIEVWQKVMEGPPPPVHTFDATVPAELAAICEKAMARDPKQRYADMGEMEEDLRAFLENRVVRAYEAGALAELRKWIRRNRATAVLGALAIALALGGMAAFSVFQAKHNEELTEARDIAEENEILAKEARDVAEKNELLAKAEREQVLRLSDEKRLDDQTEAAEHLWPAFPDKVAAMESWLAGARELAARAASHEQTLAELRERALPYTAEQAAVDRSTHERAAELEQFRTRRDELQLAFEQETDDQRAQALRTELESVQGAIELLEPVVNERQTWKFADTRDQWQHDLLAGLVRSFREFSDLETGTIASIEKRLEQARTIGTRSIDDHRADWDEAIAAIADPARSPAYGGLRIAPQMGLVPLGPDPRSGLWEFADLQTGAAPVRDEDGELLISGETGLVLVLLPGGTFIMGAQKDDPAGPHYDPYTQSNQGPPHDVTLAPFFLSKYEVTQGQWVRFVGMNPSIYQQPSRYIHSTEPLLHPVEQVSWAECLQTVVRLGMALPTEAQWEYGARAGTDTIWSTGDERDSLEGSVNLADQAAKRAGANWPAIADWPELDDGWPVHAPVGSYEPNAFGLHDVHGNVWEWCRDGQVNYDRLQPAEGDGGRDFPGVDQRASRGGSFQDPAVLTRCALRGLNDGKLRANNLGLRPARVLETR